MRIRVPALFLCLVVVLAAGCARYSAPPASTLPAAYTLATGAVEAEQFRTRDALTLFGQWWLPEAETPKGVVVLIHGTFIHSGFYEPWANELSRHGYAVLGLDLRGWGQSQGYGRRGNVKRFGQYVEDATLAIKRARERFPGVPVFVQGESMGGVVALLTQTRRVPVRDARADGLILNAPAVRIGLKVGPFREPYWLVRYSTWLLSFTSDPFPNAPLLYNGRALELGANVSLNDDELIRRYKQDPLVLHKALPASYPVELHRGGRDVHKRLAEIQVPVLILQGTDDELVNPDSNRWLVENLKTKDKQLKVYPGLTHATLFDSGHEAVWADILAWLEQRTGGTDAGQ